MHAGHRFEGKNVMVIGGGSEGSAESGAPMGNGRAIALRLAAEGATVAVTDRDLSRAQQTVDALESRRGVALRADAASVEESSALASRAEAEIGPLDVVICNVGITGDLPGRVQTVDDWELVNDVNVRSHWLAAQGALPGMLERGTGTFVFVTSIAGLLCSGSSLSYEASKASLIAVSRHFGVRYADRGIRSNAVALGVIDSTMVRREFGDDQALARQRDLMQPMRRQGNPSESAAAVAFLASEDASFITGQCLVVDGGRTADAGYDRRYRAELAT